MSSGRDTESLQQAFNGSSACGMPQHEQQVGHPRRASAQGLRYAWQAFREDRLRTVSRAALQTRYPEVDRDRCSLEKEVSKPSPVATMPSFRVTAEGRTRSCPTAWCRSGVSGHC